MGSDRLQAFIDDVGRVVRDTTDEHEITDRVAVLMSALLSDGYELPPELTRPSPARPMTYPLYVAPDDSLSIASVVWDLDQRTNVHSHETWGVVGIYAGSELETRYLKPATEAVPAPLTPAGETRWVRGQVNVCCTTDDDVHSVAAVGTEPTIGIHVYGGNISKIRRLSYDPATGDTHWFMSDWDQPAEVFAAGPASDPPTAAG